jgi:hypothetical protein
MWRVKGLSNFTQEIAETAVYRSGSFEIAEKVLLHSNQSWRTD